MKIVAGILLLLGITAGLSAQSAQPTGFIQLFDGKTLNNWVVDDPQYAKNFSVQNGLLHVEGVGGWLRSTRQYSDYTLRLEFRYLTEAPGVQGGRGGRGSAPAAGDPSAAQGGRGGGGGAPAAGNPAAAQGGRGGGGRVGVGGVFVRTPGTSTYQSGWPDNSLEVSLANAQGGRPALPGDGRWGGAVVRHGNLGGPTSFDTRTALLSYGKTGDWQTLEIQAIGDAIHVTLNGNYLGTGSAGGNARGFIGLKAVPGVIEFRTLEINEGVKGLVPRTAEGFVPLFDGKTLAGWKRETPDSPGFDIVDGALAVRGRSASAPNRPACNLSIWTEKEYGDFTLRYQARFETNASVGGLLFRNPASGGPVCPQCGTTKQGGWNQIETRAMGDPALPWNGIVERAAAAEQGDTMFDYRAAALAYTATEDWTKDWVDFEVQVRGGRVAVWVNGFLVSTAEDVLPLKGIFGLQCERETVEYRNILIREMPPADERKTP